MVNREMFYYASQQGQMNYESYAVMGESVNKLLTGTTGISPKDALTKGFTRVNYAIFASESVISAFIEPLLYGLSRDYNAPEDINADLEGYGCKAEISTDTPLSFLQRVIRYFKIVFSIIFKKN